MKKSIATMTKEELQNYKREWYNNNKTTVQKARLIKGLKDNNRSLKPSTLQKYGIEITKKNKIIIKEPIKLRFKNENVINKTTQPHIVNVVVKPPPPIEQYKDTNKKLNYKELTDFIATKLEHIPPILSAGTLNAYARLPDALFEMYGEPIDPLKDLTEWLCNSTKFIEAFYKKKSWKTDSTRSKALGQFLRLSVDFEPYKAALSQEDSQALNSQTEKWSNSADAIVKARTESTPLFEFFTIKNEVLKKYTEYSYEYLFYILYDCIIPRDDLNGFTVIYNDNEIPDKGNYLLINKAIKEGSIVMREYKTKGVYFKKVYPLTSQCMDIILKLHSGEEVQPVRQLFPGLKNKLSSWVPKICLPFPEFKTDSIGIRYLRKSHISSRLLKLKNSSVTDKANEMVTVSGLSMNSVKTQQGSYISPLKKLNGKPFITPKKLQEANEAVYKELTHFYNTRSKKVATK
jgi:hypothetical protein